MALTSESSSAGTAAPQHLAAVVASAREPSTISGFLRRCHAHSSNSASTNAARSIAPPGAICPVATWTWPVDAVSGCRRGVSIPGCGCGCGACAGCLVASSSVRNVLSLCRSWRMASSSSLESSSSSSKLLSLSASTTPEDTRRANHILLGVQDGVQHCFTALGYSTGVHRCTHTKGVQPPQARQDQPQAKTSSFYLFLKKRAKKRSQRRRSKRGRESKIAQLS